MAAHKLGALPTFFVIISNKAWLAKLTWFLVGTGIFVMVVNFDFF
jgi:hypothetical protein